MKKLFGGSGGGGKLQQQPAPRSIEEHASTTTLHIQLRGDEDPQSWTIVVNQYISFADLKATLVAQFDLQSPIRIYKGQREIGLRDGESIHGTLKNSDSIVVRREESPKQDSSPFLPIMDTMSAASATATMCGRSRSQSAKIENWLPQARESRLAMKKEGEQWVEFPTGHEAWDTPNGRINVPTSFSTRSLKEEEDQIRLAMQISAASHGSMLSKHIPQLQEASKWPSPASQEEADLQHAIELSAAHAMYQSHATCSERPPDLPDLSNFHNYEAVPVPQNDVIGAMVAQGTVSQYFLDGGRSACTSICLLAARGLLNPGLSLSRITPADLDKWVEQGVYRHQSGTTAHASLEELWDLPVFRETTRSLEKGLPFQGTVAEPDALYEAFRHALEFGAGADRIALGLTKSGETILCLNDSSHWYLFDSHGQSHEQTKLVYLKQFDNLDELIQGLQAKYPRQKFGDGSLQGDMYNMFEAIPVVLTEQKPSATEVTFDQSEQTSGQEALEWMAWLAADSKTSNSGSLPVSPATVLVAPPILAAKANPTCDSQSSPQAPLSAGSPSKTTTTTPNASETAATIPPLAAVDPPSLFNKSDYEDPIMYTIMADPVTCDDGHTYDREVIERCFEDRIKAEAARQAAGAQPSGSDEERQQEEAIDNYSAACCGARAPIKLLSPKTNQVVSDKLVPNRTLEQQIVRLVEANYLDMTEAEIEDWEQRREEKRLRDKEREEQQKLEREREEEMRRNAEEAERNRSMDDQSEGPPNGPQEPSIRVRIDRDTSNEAEKLCEGDLGVSVVISQKGLRVPVDFADLGDGGSPRCMVACCASRLVSIEYHWCARCARLACDGCLSYVVTDFADSQSSEGHTICVECATQLVDAMESGDILIRQKRAILLRDIGRQHVQLGNRAARLQESIARQEASEQFAPRFTEMEDSIGRLEQQLSELMERARCAHERAAEVRESDRSEVEDAATSYGKVSVEHLTQQCTRLEEELTALDEQETPNDDEELVRHLEAVSGLSHRLEGARTQLAIAYSTVHGTRAPSTSNADSPSVEDLEQECNRLTERLTELSTTVFDDDDDEAGLARTLQLSSLGAQLEETQMQLASARSLSTRPSVRIPEMTKFLRALMHCDSRSSARKGFFSRRRHSEPASEFSSILAAMDSAHASILNSGPDTMAADSRERASELLTLLGRMESCLQSEQIPVEGLEAAREDVSRFLTNSQTSTTPDAPAQPPLSVSEDLLSEYVRLSSQDVSEIPEDEQEAHVLRLSELEAVLREAEAAILSGSTKTPSFSTGRPSSPSSSTFEEARQDLNAIGQRSQEWPLPLGLEYPTERMERQLEILQNNLQLRLVESQRTAEAELTERLTALQERRDHLEDQVAEARRSLDSAEANAAAEEERFRERAERRRQEEATRMERERVLRERAEKAGQEAEELRRRHDEAEAATRAAFANATGSNTRGAENFGGIGDLRMCRRCRAGPIENMACDNLRTHNDMSTRYYGRTVASRSNPNHCPHCNWFDADWNQWPYWDGIHGPH